VKTAQVGRGVVVTVVPGVVVTVVPGVVVTVVPRVVVTVAAGVVVTVVARVVVTVVARVVVTVAIGVVVTVVTRTQHVLLSQSPWPLFPHRMTPDFGRLLAGQAKLEQSFGGIGAAVEHGLAGGTTGTGAGAGGTKGAAVVQGLPADARPTATRTARENILQLAMFRKVRCGRRVQSGITN